MGTQVQCGSCRQQFMAGDELIGQQVPCPSCSSPILVQAVRTLSIEVACETCKSRFAAEPHLVGTQVACPTCHSPILVTAAPEPKLAPAPTPAPQPVPTPAQPSYQFKPKPSSGSQRPPRQLWPLILVAAGALISLVISLLTGSLLLGLGLFGLGLTVAAIGFAPLGRAKGYRVTAILYVIFALLIPLGVSLTKLNIGLPGIGDMPTAYQASDYPLPEFPPLPPPTSLNADVNYRLITLDVPFPEAGNASRLMIYMPSGQHAANSLPCVFMIDAGAYGVTGMSLSTNPNDAERLPYVQAGFAVVVYEVDGVMEDGENANGLEWRKAIRQYWNCAAGMVNARNAIEYTLANVRAIDPNRLYAAGHSSAGTHALLLAAHEPRIKGTLAYAPVADLSSDLSEGIDELKRVVPDIDDLIQLASPLAHEQKLNCPLFLFHARDDQRVPFYRTSEFANRVRSHNANVTLELVSSGGHFDSMISAGLPKGIAWLQKQAGMQAPATGLVLNNPNRNSGPNGAPTPDPAEEARKRHEEAMERIQKQQEEMRNRIANQNNPPENEPPKSEPEKLLNDLVTGNVFAQRDALTALSLMNPEEIEDEELRTKITARIRQLATERGSFQGNAIKAIAVWHDEESVSVLINMIGARGFVASELYSVLGKLKDPRAALPVAQKLGDFFDHDHAFNCLREMGPVAEDALIAAAPSNNAKVSIAALTLLAQFGTEKSIPILGKAQRSANPQVRELAKQGLKQVRERKDAAAKSDD